MAHESAAKIIRDAREALGWTQTELAKRVGTKQQTIDKIEAGKINHSRFFGKIAHELGVNISDIAPEFGDSPKDQLIKDADLRSTDRDFPVHAAAEGGRGEIIVSSDPVSWVLRPTPLVGVSRAYGIIIVGESMVPEFRPGDTALIHPHLPPKRDETFIFYSENNGEVKATIKHLLRWTDTAWVVRQWNPPKGGKEEFSLSKNEWPRLHRVVGKYSR